MYTTANNTIPKKKKSKKAQWLSEEALQIGEERRGMQIRCQALFDHAFYFLFKITSTAKSMKGTEGNLDIFCKCQELDEPRQVHIKGPVEAVTMN